MLHIPVVDFKTKTLYHLGNIFPNEKMGSAGQSPRFRKKKNNNNAGKRKLEKTAIEKTEEKKKG